MQVVFTDAHGECGTLEVSSVVCISLVESHPPGLHLCGEVGVGGNLCSAFLPFLCLWPHRGAQAPIPSARRAQASARQGTGVGRLGAPRRWEWRTLAGMQMCACAADLATYPQSPAWCGEGGFVSASVGPQVTHRIIARAGLRNTKGGGREGDSSFGIVSTGPVRAPVCYFLGRSDGGLDHRDGFGNSRKRREMIFWSLTYRMLQCPGCPGWRRKDN